MCFGTEESLRRIIFMRPEEASRIRRQFVVAATLSHVGMQSFAAYLLLAEQP